MYNSQQIAQAVTSVKLRYIMALTSGRNDLRRGLLRRLQRSLVWIEKVGKDLIDWCTIVNKSVEGVKSKG